MSVRGALGQVRAGLDACAGESATFLSDDELITAMDDVMASMSRLSSVQLGLVRELDGRGLAVRQGAASLAHWLRERFLIGGDAAKKLVGLAADLDRFAHQVRDALAEGRVNVEQAQVICRALTDLPDEVDAEIRQKAEAHLVDFAVEFDPVRLVRLGRRIVQTADPEFAERFEAELLRKQEERAYRANLSGRGPAGGLRRDDPARNHGRDRSGARPWPGAAALDRSGTQGDPAARRRLRIPWL